uniref:hypothetical protein n=2 Tax=Vibrionaceae TaxID=641 RepID=UPI00301D89E9
RTAGCGKSSLRPLMAGSSPSLPDGSNPSAAIVQSASDVQCSRLLKTTARMNIDVSLKSVLNSSSTLVHFKWFQNSFLLPGSKFQLGIPLKNWRKATQTAPTDGFSITPAILNGQAHPKATFGLGVSGTTTLYGR